MMNDMLQALQPFGCTPVSVEELSLPLDESQDGLHLLIVPSDNIMEMIEEAIEEAGTMVAFVEEQLDSMKDMGKTEAFRSIVTAFVTDTGLEMQEGKSLSEIYAAYASVWAGETLIHEEIAASSSTLPDIDANWIEDQIEDGLLLLPLTPQKRYHAPLIVPMGGFNECPLPVYQAAVFRCWQEEYGLTPCVVTQDKWIVRAEKLPETDEQALQLAKEHFMFCQYVLETFDTIGQYAEYLKHHHMWYFWWD